MNGPRTQAQRDAVTVEIGFALLTGAVLAGLSFLAFLGARAVLPLPDGGTWLTLAGSTSATVFVARVLYVLSRARPGEFDADGAEGADAAAQPSQPGRTSPDS